MPNAQCTSVGSGSLSSLSEIFIDFYLLWCWGSIITQNSAQKPAFLWDMETPCEFKTVSRTLY